MLLLFFFPRDEQTIGKTCDLFGDWSQVTTIIDSRGEIQNLIFTVEEVPEDLLLEYEKKIHSIYFSGQGNIEIDPSPTLSFSKNKICYKGTKLGRFEVRDDCSTIVLQKEQSKEHADVFNHCTIIHRYKNIMVVKQGKERVFYLRRDASNPYFVGN